MKNVSLVLNIILLVAVVVLYVLYFSNNSSGKSSASGNDTTAVDVSIAYINVDTLYKYYDFYNDSKVSFENKAKVMDQDLQNRFNAWQTEVQAAERNVNNMTFGQVQAVKENLGKKQQNLAAFEQTVQQKMMQEQAKITKDLYDRVTNFLKDYSKQNNIQVVLQYSPSSDVLYGGEALDITKPVTDGLNALYKEEKSKAKTDTVAK